MKKLIAIGIVSSVLLLGSGSAQAGDREWATAGKILAGVAAASIITDLATRPTYHDVYYTRPVYRPYPVYRRTYYHSYPSVSTYVSCSSGDAWVYQEDVYYY